MRPIPLLRLLVLLSSFALPDYCRAEGKATATLIFHRGKIVTMDKNKPEARALAIRGDRILAVGSEEKILALRDQNTRVIDLQGKLMIPGFIESHGHFVSLGRSRMMLDLSTAKSWEDVIDQVAKAVKGTPPGKWIVGRGWHQEKWQRKPNPNFQGYPHHAALSQISPKNPVLLTHASGHMSIANAEAMKLAKIDATTKNPSGGEILRDDRGQPTGVFRETAQGLVGRAYQRALRTLSAEEKRKDLLHAIDLASKECLRHGVTSFQDAGTDLATIDVFKKLAAEKKLRVRLWVMINESNDMLAQFLARYFLVGFGDNFLTVRAIKRILDGALGAHGAWLLNPYDDLPGKSGLNTYPLPALRETARLAAKHNYQLCVHAIGDRANRETLNIFEEAFQKYPSKEPRRWRIEHAQHLHADDIQRFAKLGVIASMQGIHCTSDAPYVLKRLGIRRSSEGAYVWGSLLKSGAIIANGTDVPVEPIDPIKCFYASVTRKMANGTAFFPEQKMTRIQALKSYTLDAAYAAHEENSKGSLTPGKLADMVILSRDILTIPEEQILQTEVEMTILGGNVVYQPGN